MKQVYLGLGSNVGDRAGYLQDALDRLHSPALRILRVSPVYETEPVDVCEQPWFLNAVAQGETDLFPLQLLTYTGKVEKALGRKRSIAKGPRTIDIDILFYGQSVIRAPRLVIPHSRVAERRFVLQPLADLAPGLRHPASRRTVRELLEAAPAQSVRPTGIRLHVPAAADA